MLCLETKSDSAVYTFHFDFELLFSLTFQAWIPQNCSVFWDPEMDPAFDGVTVLGGEGPLHKCLWWGVTVAVTHIRRMWWRQGFMFSFLRSSVFLYFECALLWASVEPSCSWPSLSRALLLRSWWGSDLEQNIWRESSRHYLPLVTAVLLVPASQAPRWWAALCKGGLSYVCEREGSLVCLRARCA